MIEAVKNALPLEAVLRDAGVHLERGKTRCPFHEDRSPSFSVKGARWTCFAGCGSGDVLDFAARYYGLDTRGAIKLLAGRAGIKTGRQTPAEIRAVEKARKERERKQELVRAFREWERERVNEIAEVLRRYRHLRATRNDFTEAELASLAELQGEIDYLECIYEHIFCKADDEPKYRLYREEMAHAG